MKDKKTSFGRGVLLIIPALGIVASIGGLFAGLSLILGPLEASPKGIHHLGTCLQCGGKGDVLTIAADPLDLSLCGDCLAFLMGDAAGIRSAIRDRWAMTNRRAAVPRHKGPFRWRPTPSSVL